jgi:hypothetical protein
LFRESAERLSHETNTKIEEPIVLNFREKILQGEFDSALEFLEKLLIKPEQKNVNDLDYKPK